MHFGGRVFVLTTLTIAEQIMKEKQNFQRVVVSREEALSMFQENKFKVEIISALPADATISLYRSGSILVPKTKILSIARPDVPACAIDTVDCPSPMTLWQCLSHEQVWPHGGSLSWAPSAQHWVSKGVCSQCLQQSLLACGCQQGAPAGGRLVLFEPQATIHGI